MPCGRVEKVEKTYTIVKMERQGMCGECHACDAFYEKKDCTLKCINLVGAKEGDVVELKVAEEKFLKASYIMYGLPLMGMLVGMLAGYFISKGLGALDTDIPTLIGAFIGIGAMLIYIRVKDKKEKFNNYAPQIIWVQKEGQAQCENKSS